MTSTMTEEEQRHMVQALRESGWSVDQIAKQMRIGFDKAHVLYRRKEDDAPREDRFWAMVDRRGRNECWEWKGPKYDGWGRFLIEMDGSRVRLGAHRYSWELVHGALPHGRALGHRCNNRGCVNPRHMWLKGHRRHETLDQCRRRMRKEKREKKKRSAACLG